MKTEIVSIMAVCFCALSTPPAEATLITIAIEAEIDSVSDPYNFFEGNIKVGDIIKGTYSYDTSTPDSSPSSVSGFYWHYNPPAGISLTAGGLNFKNNPSSVDFLVHLVNDNQQGGDVYELSSYNNLTLANIPSIEHIFWILEDSTGSALSSDALPTAAPILDDWQFNRLMISGPDRAPSFGIEAHVTSAVPEPVAILLFGLESLLLRKRL